MVTSNTVCTLFLRLSLSRSVKLSNFKVGKVDCVFSAQNMHIFVHLHYIQGCQVLLLLGISM